MLPKMLITTDTPNPWDSELVNLGWGPSIFLKSFPREYNGETRVEKDCAERPG